MGKLEKLAGLTPIPPPSRLPSPAASPASLPENNAVTPSQALFLNSQIGVAACLVMGGAWLATRRHQGRSILLLVLLPFGRDLLKPAFLICCLLDLAAMTWKISGQHGSAQQPDAAGRESAAVRLSR